MELSTAAKHFWCITRQIRRGKKEDPNLREGLRLLAQKAQHVQILERINRIAIPATTPTPSIIVALRTARIIRLPLLRHHRGPGQGDDR